MVHEVGGASNAAAARKLPTTQAGNVTKKNKKDKETVSSNTFMASDGNKYEYGKFYSVSQENKIKSEMNDMIHSAGIKGADIVNTYVSSDEYFRSASKVKKEDQHLVDDYYKARKDVKYYGWDEVERREKALGKVLTEPTLRIKKSNKKYDTKTGKGIRGAHEDHNITIWKSKDGDNYAYRETVTRWGKTGHILGEKRISKGLSKKQIIQRIKKFSGEEWRDDKALMW